MLRESIAVFERGKLATVPSVPAISEWPEGWLGQGLMSGGPVDDRGYRLFRPRSAVSEPPGSRKGNLEPFHLEVLLRLLYNLYLRTYVRPVRPHSILCSLPIGIGRSLGFLRRLDVTGG
jgi:hypothetical protein